MNDLSVNDKSKIHAQEKNDNVKNETIDQEQVNEEENVKHRSVSAIVQELQRDLKRPLMEVIVLFIKCSILLNDFNF